MAKRKRLNGPLPDQLATAEPSPVRTGASAAPIARVAGETSINAAFSEVSRELMSARTEGRLVVRIPLDSIEPSWLIRDRTHPGTERDPDFVALLGSLRQHGQRTPIEVVQIEESRYGLISGWRRLTALKQLFEETGENRFATALAFLRQPESSEEAYVAMVEENEIRLGLSYYERAQITAKSVEAGIYPSTKAALQSLFATASRAKRSKIGSFLTLYLALEDKVRFPQALTERLGLSMVKVLEADKTAAKRLRAQLGKSRVDSPEAEQSLLSAFMEAEGEKSAGGDGASEAAPPSNPSAKSPSPESLGSAAPEEEVCPGVYLSHSKDTLKLSGPAVDSEFRAQLEAWLRSKLEV